MLGLNITMWVMIPAAFVLGSIVGYIISVIISKLKHKKHMEEENGER